MSLPDQTASQSPHEHGNSLERKPWITPSVTELPKLKNLILQTGGAVGGGNSVIP